jgi:N-acyl amino acid synthase of PEP-CTERM/exosortase system
MPRLLALDGSDRRQLVDPSALSEKFDQHFQVELADTPASLSEALALRYQVYCLERGFEDPASNPDGHERDEFDERSVHAIVRHRPTAS